MGESGGIQAQLPRVLSKWSCRRFNSSCKDVWQYVQCVANQRGSLESYGLNVCIPPEFVCWNINPQYDGIWRWDHWEVIRSWGWSPHAGIRALIKQTWESLLPLSSLHHVRIQWEDGHLPKPKGKSTPDTRSAGTLILDFPTCWTVRNKCLLFKPPSLNLLY